MIRCFGDGNPLYEAYHDLAKDESRLARRLTRVGEGPGGSVRERFEAMSSF
jgi:hypothetical protein